MAAAVDRVAAERMLITKLGMECEAKDHRRYALVIDGRIIARTFVSTGSAKYKTLGDDLVGKMARQLGVTSTFFVGLVNCSKSREDFLAFHRARGTI